MKIIWTFLLSLVLVATTAKAAQNVVVIFDESGSMSENIGNEVKIDAAKRGMGEVIGRLPDDSNLGVLTLNHGWLVPLGQIDKIKAVNAVTTLQADGGTPLGAAMKIASDSLLQLRAKLHYGTYTLLIVTDGDATDPDVVSAYTPDILSRGIVIDLIGVNMDDTHQLSHVAKIFRNVKNPSDLRMAMNTAIDAETTSNGSATDSDFALIAPIPAGVAKASLAALADMPNYPIGEQPPVTASSSSSGQTSADQSQAATSGSTTTTPAPADNSFFVGFLVFIGIIVVVVFLVIIFS